LFNLSKNLTQKIKNLLVKILAGAIRLAMFFKKVFIGIGRVIYGILAWVARKMILPILIAVYKLLKRINKALAPAERQITLAVTHRRFLHIVLGTLVLLVSGGNIYARSKNLVYTGEQSVLYRYLSGAEDVIVESGPPKPTEPQSVDENSVGDEAAAADNGFGESPETEGSAALIELGALMPTSVAPTGAPHRTQTEKYTVLPGDTLSGIADKFGISIATILWENKLTVRDYLQLGQTLTILPSSGVSYTVKSGDTVAKIAAAFSASADDINSWNSLSGQNIVKGQKLFIPGGMIAAPPAPKPKRVISPVNIFTAPPAAVDTGTADLLWPTSSHRITQYFGVWELGRRSLGRHTGLDIGGNIGDTVYAADDGIVTHAGCGSSCRKGYGYYVDIDHGNGIITRYGHASQIIVKVGDQVRRGDPIMLMGCTGMCTGPHVHFEVRLNGRVTNPLPYIQ
jgi:murein DD-endopeptidase MepM/ murein hydrolase activator NlpD